MNENIKARRGRPVNEALHQTIVDAACDLFIELGFQATTMDKVARRAQISKLSIYKHFENKEALFSAAIAVRCKSFAPDALFSGAKGTAEDQLLAVALTLLKLLLSPDVVSVKTMIMADKTNQAHLSRLFYEAGPAQFITQIETLLCQLHASEALSVPSPRQSARLFGALFQGSDLLTIAGFDANQAEEDIATYCRSAVGMFIAAHRSH